MSAKAEIGWRRVDDQGERCQLYAHRVGGEWRFFMRHRRYEPWRPVPNPELVDWLELLRGIERRLPRRRHPPDELQRVRRRIRELFPEATLDP